MITYSVFMMQFLRKLRFFMFHETVFEKNGYTIGHGSVRNVFPVWFQETIIEKDTCILMFIEALFKIVRT